MSKRSRSQESVTVDEDMKRDLEEIALKTGLTKSFLIRCALNNFVKDAKDRLYNMGEDKRFIAYKI
ncbi:MAG: CopG family transcriptional regulator [Sphingobacteriia bacterium]|nr:CopG family transcriptional regulator [Sphingobacteriia bacterium]